MFCAAVLYQIFKLQLPILHLPPLRTRAANQFKQQRKSSFYIKISLLCAQQDYFKNSKTFWDVLPCSLADVYQCFEGTYCVSLQDRRVSQVGQ
jgi:hypothetical protein